jgi:hypothetical protein
MLRNSLIGYTGFVGSNLRDQRKYSALFNSKNIADFPNQVFDMTVCAGVSATMWLANNEPEKDWGSIAQLMDQLERGSFRHLVVISTNAVFEDTALANIEGNEIYNFDTPYGYHRRKFEQFCRSSFDHVTILRLPALFGCRLKKNFLFDLLNPEPSFCNEELMGLLQEDGGREIKAIVEKCYQYDVDKKIYYLDRDVLKTVDKSALLSKFLGACKRDAKYFTNSESRYQFYNIEYLAADIDRCIEENISVLNLTSEPIAASELYSYLTDQHYSNSGPAKVLQNVRSSYADIWNGKNGYLYSREQTLSDMRTFYNNMLGVL